MSYTIITEPGTYVIFNYDYSFLNTRKNAWIFIYFGKNNSDFSAPPEYIDGAFELDSGIPMLAR